MLGGRRDWVAEAIVGARVGEWGKGGLGRRLP